MPHPFPFSLCVFCGSSHGQDPQFAALAYDVGREIARRGWRLVYGGGKVGLMGIVADAALEAGAEVIGVIPRFLYEWEVGHDGLTHLEIVDSLSERKRRMGELSDAYLSLPGGIGTLDEMFEALSWTQVRVESKPNGLLNRDGYFDGLLAFLGRATSDGFMKPEHRDLLAVDTEPAALLDQLFSRAAAQSR